MSRSRFMENVGRLHASKAGQLIFKDGAAFEVLLGMLRYFDLTDLERGHADIE